MSDDIIFIKNENDYNEYSKLKPIKKYKRQKVKFICTCCNKESIKTFQFLKLPFTCTSCEISIGHKNYKNKNLDNITFLHNTNDYVEYGKLKPIYKYIYKNVRFNCTKCGKEKTKTYKRLTSDLICDNCLRSASHLTVKFKENFKRTNIKQYGTEHPMQSETIQEKYRNNNYKKYGVEFPMQLEIVKEKHKDTCKELYGVEYPMQSDHIKDKFKQTCKEKYGVDNPVYSIISHEKYKHTIFEKQKAKYDSILAENKLKFLYRDSTKTTFLQCMQCNSVFSLSSSAFINNLNKAHFNCKICGIHDNISNEEKELVEYIKTIYDGKIIENDRNILKCKELDIYLPDLNIGIEFDGTYWHADSRFYNETTIIGYRCAKEIWLHDKEKDLLCEKLNINLIRIKEYDWRNNQDIVKTSLLNVINASN